MTTILRPSTLSLQQESGVHPQQEQPQTLHQEALALSDEGEFDAA
jgi:hypothetical protein